jgi:transposase
MAGIRHHAPVRDAVSWHPKLRSNNTGKLAAWLKDAHQSGLYAMQRFARTLRRDIDALRNAITEHWSNGQTEGHINRLKTLKRAICGHPIIAVGA